MNQKLIFLIVFSILLFAGLFLLHSTRGKKESLQSQEGKENPGEEISFTIVKEEPNSPFDKKQNIVITSQKQYNDLWKRLFPIDRSAPEENFEKYTIIALFQGEQPSSGYEIKVQRIVQSDQALGVYLQEEIPDKNCQETQIKTAPYQIVRIQKPLTETMRFYEKTEIKECT